MKLYWIEKEFVYDGSQLRSQFAYLQYHLLGDSIVSWRGPCRIPKENIVDGEDLIQGSSIQGRDMLHFIMELFNRSLFSSVCLQRLMASIVIDLINEILVVSGKEKIDFLRRGDDIFFNEGKMSISVATVSPFSAMVHFALNITNEGTPVKTCSLFDFGIDPKSFAEQLMKRVAEEIRTIEEATQKVRWIK